MWLDPYNTPTKWSRHPRFHNALLADALRKTRIFNQEVFGIPYGKKDPRTYRPDPTPQTTEVQPVTQDLLHTLNSAEKYHALQERKSWLIRQRLQDKREVRNQHERIINFLNPNKHKTTLEKKRHYNRRKKRPSYNQQKMNGITHKAYRLLFSPDYNKQEWRRIRQNQNAKRRYHEQKRQTP